MNIIIFLIIGIAIIWKTIDITYFRYTKKHLKFWKLLFTDVPPCDFDFSRIFGFIGVCILWGYITFALSLIIIFIIHNLFGHAVISVLCSIFPLCGICTIFEKPWEKSYSWGK